MPKELLRAMFTRSPTLFAMERTRTEDSSVTSLAVWTRGGRRIDGESSFAVLSMPKRAPDGDDSARPNEKSTKSL